MYYLPMWPRRRKKSPSLPLGVYIIYEEGDDVELLHLLFFLQAHFALTKEDFTEERIKVDEKRFPKFLFDEKPVPFKYLLSSTEEEWEIGETIGLGFRYENQTLFRAYKAHLDEDGDAEDGLKGFFSEIEASYFGTPPQLN